MQCAIDDVLARDRQIRPHPPYVGRTSKHRRKLRAAQRLHLGLPDSVTQRMKLGLADAAEDSNASSSDDEDIQQATAALHESADLLSSVRWVEDLDPDVALYRLQWKTYLLSQAANRSCFHRSVDSRCFLSLILWFSVTGISTALSDLRSRSLGCCTLSLLVSD